MISPAMPLCLTDNNSGISILELHLSRPRIILLQSYNGSLPRVFTTRTPAAEPYPFTHLRQPSTHLGEVVESGGSIGDSLGDSLGASDETSTLGNSHRARLLQPSTLAGHLSTDLGTVVENEQNVDSLEGSLGDSVGASHETSILEASALSRQPLTPVASAAGSARDGDEAGIDNTPDAISETDPLTLNTDVAGYSLGDREKAGYSYHSLLRKH